MKSRIENIREIWNIVKRFNIQIIEVPESGEREWDRDSIEEITYKSYQIWWMTLIYIFKKLSKLLRWINTKKSIPKYIIMKLLKWKVKRNTVIWRDRYGMESHLAGVIPSKYSMFWGQWWWQQLPDCARASMTFARPALWCVLQMLFLEA